MEGKYTVLDSQLQPMSSEKHDGSDEEEIIRVQKKGGRSGQCLFLLLIIFAIIAISAIIAVIGLAIALGVRSSQSQASGQTSPTLGPTTGPTMTPTDSGSSTCLTQGCVQLAAQISSAMNQSVDPCQDFYQFSCGNWGQRNLIPPGRDLQNQLVKPQLTIYQRLANMITNGGNNSQRLEATRKAFDVYRSCMDAAAIESRGATPLLNLIRNRLGGWPLIGIPDTPSMPWSINSTSFFYEKAIGGLALFGFKLFFNAVTQSRSKYVLHFEQQQVSLTAAFTNISDAVTTYATTLSLFNSSVNLTTYAEALQNALEFEQRLNKILEQRVPNIVDGDPEPLLNESNIYTLERLRTLWPGFDWEGFINYLYVNLSGLAVPENLEIVVTTPDYFEKLGPLLQNTSQEVIRDYTKVLFAISQFSSLSSQFAGKRNNFSDPTPGDLIACVSFVQIVLPIALARPFVEQFVPEGTREGVAMMINYVLQGFKERVNEMDWLSDLSKQRSIEKAEAITSQVAYPAQIFDDDYVNGLYSRFTADPNDFYSNRLSAAELVLRLRLNLTYGFDKAAWPTDPSFVGFPTLVNAAYNRQSNQIYVMAAIANEPAFRADWPDYSLFGSLGSSVGHEITHGFDNNGQQYDKDGVRRMWWSNESQVEFNSRLQCFIDQYNQYSAEGVQVNGQISLPENLADNGGLHASFQAYRMRAATTPQPRLPSLPYTPEQLFFIAYGQNWCELALPSYYQNLVRTDPHAPGPARALAVTNSPEFAEAFNCPVGSPMNPTNKCIIW